MNTIVSQIEILTTEQALTKGLVPHKDGARLLPLSEGCFSCTKMNLPNCPIDLTIGEEEARKERIVAFVPGQRFLYDEDKSLGVGYGWVAGNWYVKKE